MLLPVVLNKVYCIKDDQLKFIPTDTTANPCIGKVFKIEIHHQQVEEAGCGDNVGMNIRV